MQDPIRPSLAVLQHTRRRRQRAIALRVVVALTLAVVVAVVSIDHGSGSVRTVATTQQNTTIAVVTEPIQTSPLTAAAMGPDTTAMTSTSPAGFAPKTTVPATSKPETTAPPTLAPETAAPVTIPAATKAPTVNGATTTPTADGSATTKPTKPTKVATPRTSNCTNVGTLTIPTIGVAQPVLAEANAYADGSLCGNKDGTTQGVDILPGFASLASSVAGGGVLQGQIPAIIFGHRNSHNHPFHDIPNLQAGDTVTVALNDGTVISLSVATVQLMPLAKATAMLLSPSPDGSAMVRFVACAHPDGSPGGVTYRWIVTAVPVV